MSPWGGAARQVQLRGAGEVNQRNANSTRSRGLGWHIGSFPLSLGLEQGVSPAGKNERPEDRPEDVLAELWP